MDKTGTTTSVKLKKSNSSKTGLYLLFAELIHREVNPQLLELLRQPEVLKGFTEIDPACADYFSKEWSESDFENAAVDFCDLFILPESGSAPRAAAWLEIGGDLTAEVVDSVVTKFITEWKIHVPPSYQHLAYDHLSLIFYICVVIAEKDEALAAEFEAAVLTPWAGKFGDSLAQSSSPLYRSLGIMISHLLEEVTDY